MEILIFITVIFILILIWLNIIASIALKYDQTLDAFQKKAQLLVVWLLPALGASLVLKMVLQHSPEAIPRKLIPWPFKEALFGKEHKPNSIPDENEIDNIRSNYTNRNQSFGSNDVGGDSD